MNQSAAVPAVPEHRGSALDADGYIVVPTGLPPSILESVVDDIWRHANATPDDPATWYQPAVIRPRPGMVEMYHYQSMWDVRQHPAVYRIFRDLHRREELWVSIDRVAFKPPARPGQPDYDQPGFVAWFAVSRERHRRSSSCSHGGGFRRANWKQGSGRRLVARGDREPGLVNPRAPDSGVAQADVQRISTLLLMTVTALRPPDVEGLRL